MYRRFGFDAAILFSDILVVPDALGQDVRFTEGEGPQLDPIRTLEDLSRLALSRTRDKFAINNGVEDDTRVLIDIGQHAFQLALGADEWMHVLDRPDILILHCRSLGDRHQYNVRRRAYERDERFSCIGKRRIRVANPKLRFLPDCL
jgi:hypothetical protein